MEVSGARPDDGQPPVGASDTVAYLEQAVERLGSVLGDRLVGVYAGGSFALGGYAPPRSDLDVSAIVRGPLSIEQATAIADVLRHESLPCPARGLELVVYREAAVREPTTGAAYELDLNSGRALPFRFSTDPSEPPRHWYVIDRAILREHGEALYGPPARDVFGAFEQETLLTMLSESVGWHAVSRATRLDDAVLNGCRALRYADEGVWSSKPAAAEWALGGQVPDPDLVAQAVAARHADGQLSRERVDAFMAHVLGVLDEATGKAVRSPA